MSIAENNTYRVETDGFYGELFTPAENKFPRKALICFSGSDGGLELAKMLAGVFQAHGLTTLALAYVLEEGLPKQFSRVPIDYIEAAAKRLHGMGYEKVGLPNALSSFDLDIRISAITQPRMKPNRTVISETITVVTVPRKKY